MKTERPSKQRIAPADTVHTESFKSQKMQINHKSFEPLKVQWVPNGFSYGRLRLNRIQKVKQHFELQLGKQATNYTINGFRSQKCT